MPGYRLLNKYNELPTESYRGLVYPLYEPGVGVGDLNLTKDERGVFEDMAHDRHSLKSRLGFYGSLLVPLVAFAVYGAIKQDFVALLVAFGGLFLFVLWRPGYEFGRVETYKAACRKVVEHERTNT